MCLTKLSGFEPILIFMMTDYIRKNWKFDSDGNVEVMPLWRVETAVSKNGAVLRVVYLRKSGKQGAIQLILSRKQVSDVQKSLKRVEKRLSE